MQIGLQAKLQRFFRGGLKPPHLGGNMKIEKGVVTLDEKDDNFLGKLIEGTQGNISIKSPFIKGGKVDVKEVKDSKGKSLKKL
jgi:hypothetical protein